MLVPFAPMRSQLRSSGWGAPVAAPRAIIPDNEKKDDNDDDGDDPFPVPLPGAGKYHWPESHLVRGIVLATESAANHATVAHVVSKDDVVSSQPP